MNIPPITHTHAHKLYNWPINKFFGCYWVRILVLSIEILESNNEIDRPFWVKRTKLQLIMLETNGNQSPKYTTTILLTHIPVAIECDHGINEHVHIQQEEKNKQTQRHTYGLFWPLDTPNWWQSRNNKYLGSSSP